jgi:hypothetical protein
MSFTWVHDKANSHYRCFQWAKNKAGEQYSVWAIVRVREVCVSDECDWHWTAVANNTDGGVHAHESGYSQTEVLARQQAEKALTAIVQGL